MGRGGGFLINMFYLLTTFFGLDWKGFCVRVLCKGAVIDGIV